MNWDALGAIAESMGAIAVFVTLIYLAVQIRQSKELGRTQAYHLSIEQLVAGAMRPEFSLLFAAEHRALTDDEQLQLASPLTAVLYSHEILYYLWQKGQVDDALWQNIWLNNRRFLALEPSMAILRTRQGPLSAALRELLERDTIARSTATASPDPGRAHGE